MFAYRQIDIQVGMHLVNNHLLAQGYSYENLKMFIFSTTILCLLLYSTYSLCKKVKQHFTRNQV